MSLLRGIRKGELIQVTLYCKCIRPDCPNEHWADSEAAINPHGYGAEEWSAKYDAPFHLYPGMPDAEDKEDKSWPPNAMETK